LNVLQECRGTVTHCNVTQRYRVSVEDGELSLKINIHSAESYSPLRIWAHPTLRMSDKLNALKRLRGHLLSMKRSAHQMYTENLFNCDKYIGRANTSLLDSAVSDAAKKPETAFDLSIRLSSKGKTHRLWMDVITKMAIAAGKKPSDVESAMIDITGAVRLARELGVEIPIGLQGIK